MLTGACVPDLLVKSECLSGEVAAHVQEYPVVKLGSPQTSRCLEARWNIKKMY